jgi:hypothetical protein
MKSRVIFASLVLGLGLMTSKASAATTISDDSPAASKSAVATMLVNGSEKQFASYMEQKASRTARKTEWQRVVNVVSLYDNNPVALLSLSAADRNVFNDSAIALNKQLVRKADNAETLRWAAQVDYTVRIINFLWNANQSASELAETE